MVMNTRGFTLIELTVAVTVFTIGILGMLGVTAGPSPVLDGVISVSDISSIVDAFGAVPYPFTPSASVVCP